MRNLRHCRGPVSRSRTACPSCGAVDMGTRGGNGDGGNSSGAATATAATAAAMTAVVAVSMDGRRLRIAKSKHVSAYTCAPMASMGGRGRAHLGACRRSRRSARHSEPTGGGGAHPCDVQGRALSSARPLGTVASTTLPRSRCRWFSRVACAHARPREPPNKRTNDSSSYKDHNDSRRS